MAKEDLLEHVKSSVDFYELLGVAFESSESDIRSAYRKTARKYHPDKLGKDFDPEKFHLLQIANDVLSDPTAKATYDNVRNARLQKVRQNELFEGKRRQMKEELEARERGDDSASPRGAKRPRREDEMEREIKRLAEEGKRRRQEMEEKMRASGGSMPTTPTFTAHASSQKSTEESQPHAQSQAQSKIPTAPEEAEEEDEIAKLERRIREAEEAKARRRAERKARKSGIFQAADSPIVQMTPTGQQDRKDETTPIKRPDRLKAFQAQEMSSASPKFSFSPNTPRPKNDFAATMERLKAAEKQRLENEIRRQEESAQ
ncbi:MAG: hypothetical protein M1818_002601 [Claussenomyces sp. TS43310]|nr:MAG: hypothetical protein M1818_002601 [Claussenomyces sp. TS43310]